MIDERKIPDVARTAHALLKQQFRASLNVIGQQTVAVLGLNESDNWIVDFDAGVLRREIPDSSNQ